MPEPEYALNVIAHRVFGRRFDTVEIESSAGSSNDFGVQSLSPLPPPRRAFRRFIDPEHGTRRSEDEIRALFDRDPAFEYPEGRSLTDIFQPAGVRFRLVSLREAMIDSHVADLTRQSMLREVAAVLSEPGAINVFFVRDINGAHGAGDFYSPVRSPSGFAFIADRPPHGASFKRSLVTLAHELGHVLGLPHMPSDENVMRNEGTTLASLIFEPPQIPIARHRAALVAAAQPTDTVDWESLFPRRRSERDWFFEVPGRA